MTKKYKMKNEKKLHRLKERKCYNFSGMRKKSINIIYIFN